MSNLPNLVSVHWLKEHLFDDDLILLDASMNKSVHGSNSTKLVKIPTARLFDFETVFVDKDSSLSNMMPSDAVFNLEAKKLGLNKDSVIVVYDQKGVFSSARAWYMFHAMGHHNVFILDGGLPAWLDARYETVTNYQSSLTTGNFQGTLQENAFYNSDFLLANLQNSALTIVDARAEGRFSGEEDEPREGMSSGHIPNSINIPYASLLDDQRFRSKAELQQIVAALKLSKSNQFIFSCGSGVTACIVLFVFHCLGYSNLSVFDGSWSEWGANKKFPVATSDLN
ncbi:sulfurtransferase [uncultured Psychrosphaera sp.]|uniref:sulfurtransferase n=1 Tax=uncultured Psychrosphaera sp. TaxID=1403522 RepID=UPI00262D1802|nr:sulfurtransferase [uncultured Psychrosphaera sp.]